ncbi:MAG: 2-amino-4-hydroxy-6-hydroxymethyldihydropteridine diphosphokinase [Clostridia bacterium]|nr:2-amino-4-hydroxy-6-hydroxymethyldihydropteridine diphosphokinase [Clostridia bacterium]
MKEKRDKITVKNLEVYAYHGALPEENTLGQKFLISAELYTNFSAAVKNDELSLSTNYAEVCRLITDYMKQHTFRLIETAADRLTAALLDAFPFLDGAAVTVRKPWAPIGLPLETVGVRTQRDWHTAYVALGSNIGNSLQYLNNAVASLRQTKGCSVEKVSEYMITEPYGGVGQNDFLNGVLCLKTYLTAHELLDVLHEIENAAGRKREIRWGPRTLDLDIIFYDHQVIDDEQLHIPHIDMHNRVFVLEPLVQLAPYVRHPVLNKTVSQLLYDLKGKNG